MGNNPDLKPLGARTMNIDVMSNQTENTEEYIIVAYNNLLYNCQTLVGEDYWAHYILGSQTNGDGCLYSEALNDGWEECSAEDEEIIVSTPGVSVPGWCGECTIEWQLLKKEDEFEDAKYIELGVISQSNESDLQAWYKWYDSGFSVDDPDEA